MDDLSFTRHLEPETATAVDDEVSTDARAQRPTPTYRAASVLDRLNAYAAVLDCGGGCAATGA